MFHIKYVYEIPTAEAALNYAHLKPIARSIQPLDPKVQILLLLGHYILRVHKAWERRNSPHDALYAQLLDLGWVIMGHQVCLEAAHKTFKAITPMSLRTNALHSSAHV